MGKKAECSPDAAVIASYFWNIGFAGIHEYLINKKDPTVKLRQYNT